MNGGTVNDRVRVLFDALVNAIVLLEMRQLRKTAMAGLASARHARGKGLCESREDRQNLLLHYN